MYSFHHIVKCLKQVSWWIRPNFKVQISFFTVDKRWKQFNAHQEVKEDKQIMAHPHNTASFFLGGSEGKESTCNAGHPGSTPGVGRSPGEGNDSPCQYSYWRIPRTEEPGGPQTTGFQRVGHWATHTFTFTLKEEGDSDKCYTWMNLDDILLRWASHKKTSTR